MQDLQELWLFLICPVSIFGFLTICNRVRYGVSRNVGVFLWGLLHFVPMIVFVALGGNFDVPKRLIGGLSCAYLLLAGIALSTLAFLPDYSSRNGKYFADGGNWPTH